MTDFLLGRKPKYWWVNQNQTFKQEFEGGYLWSPPESVCLIGGKVAGTMGAITH